MNKFTKYLWFIPVSIICAPPVYAQLEEITVTAQRREQTLQDVPISVSAFSAQEIERSNFKGARDFLEMTPNVAFTSNDQQGSKNGDVSIRGLGDLTGGGNERLIQSRPTIGIFVDDFSTAFVASGSANPPLDDIERIEILRGPQGTYFGRNATGGAINIVTKKPDENPMVKLRLGVGNHDTYEYGLIGNVPLGDNLFARGGVSYGQSEGFMDNLHPDGNDTGYENLNTRAVLRWQPGDWTVDLTGQYINERGRQMTRVPTMVSPSGFLFTASGGPTAAAPTCGLGASIYAENGNNDKLCENAPGKTDVENIIVTVKAEYLGESFGFTSITGRIDSDMDQFEDVDNSGMDFFNRRSDYSSESISQEFRIFSIDPIEMGNIGVNWMAGVIAYEDTAQVNNTIFSGNDVVLAGTFPGGGPLFSTTPGDHPNENEISIKRDGWAAFFDLGFDLTDTLTLNISGRYSEDDDRQEWKNTFASFACGRRAVTGGVIAPFRAGCSLRTDQRVTVFTGPNGQQFASGGRFDQITGNPFTVATNSGSNFSPRIALNWAYSDESSVYANFSQGYRAAGARTSPDAIDRLGNIGNDPRSQFDEEVVTNYELGWKTYFNDRRSKLEVAVFRMDWDDMQVRLAQTRCEPSGVLVDGPASCPTGTTGFSPENVVANAESARSEGIELTGTTLLGDSLTLGAAFGYMDAKFTDFQNAPQGDVTGERLPNAPKTTASLHGQWEWDAEKYSGYIRLEANYRSEIVSRFADVPATVFPRISPSATIVNLRAGLDFGNHNFALNVANITDEKSYSGVDTFSHAGVVTTPKGQFINLTWTMTTDF